MKIKRLKKISIGDICFDIEWDKKEDGGWFSLGESKMSIGTKSRDDQQIFNVIIHELKEIIQIQQATRFYRIDCDSEYVFVYNHAQHTELCYRLTEYLAKFIK